MWPPAPGGAPLRRLVVLAPHLDDAVLSAGGLIARAVAAGTPTEVWTVFTSGPPLSELPAAFHPFADFDTRRAEDARAVVRLGASYRWFGRRERLFSGAGLTKVRQVFETPSSIDDFVNLAAIRAIAREAIDTPGTLLCSPLAIGNHRDHVEVTVAVLRELFESGGWDRHWFYEDFYATDGTSRRRHFVGRRRPWRAFRAPWTGSVSLGALMRWLALSARGPGVEHFVPEAARLTWTPIEVAIQEYEEDKIAAVMEYGSQVEAFRGARAMDGFLRRAHALTGGERFWSAAPAPGHRQDIDQSLTQ